MRLLVVAAVLMFLPLGSHPAQAQGIRRVEITPFIGWETSGSYPVDTTGNPSADVQAFRADAAKTFGLYLDYPLGDNFAAEFLWSDNPTTYSAQRVSSGVFSQAFNSRINQYQFGGLYYLRDRTTALRPYLAGSLGFTHDGAGGGNPSRMAFGVGAGGGIRYGLGSHFAVRSEARWMPTYGSSGLGTVCDTSYGLDYYGYGDYCYTATVHNYLQRFNFVVGLTIRP